MVNDRRQSGEQRDAARDQLIRLLLDRHGTGRVLFRNTRGAVQGFPPRELHLPALPLPRAYSGPGRVRLASDAPRAQLTPERRYQDDGPTPTMVGAGSAGPLAGAHPDAD